jgi:PleD family two-component response regulator
MTPEPTKAQRDHILIVDGDREASKSLTTLLNASGYDEIRAVRSTSRALAVAAKFQPAIAFLGTPAPDGIERELATLLQKNSRANGIRLIGLTDLAEPPTREEARAVGIERYLSRPVTQIELEKALRKTPGN